MSPEVTPALVPTEVINAWKSIIFLHSLQPAIFVSPLNKTIASGVQDTTFLCLFNMSCDQFPAKGLFSKILLI